MAGRLGGSVPPADPPRSSRESSIVATETLSNIIFTGPLAWTADAHCTGQTDLFFAPAGERPEARVVREGRARAICRDCPVLLECRDWAREHREYGFWGGESEEERAAAGFRVDMPVGRVARYPKGHGQPVAPRTPRVA
jgi:WhiB family redox-sensing transcriptional regulator